MTLGDRVAVLNDGVLQQVDQPQALFARPKNLFVAAFIGSPPMNLVEATIGPGEVAFGGHRIAVDVSAGLERFEGRPVILGIRPSDMEDASVWRDDDLPTIEVVPDVIEELGSEVNVLFSVDAPRVATEEALAALSERGEARELVPLGGDEGRAIFCARVDARTSARPGERIRLSCDPRRFHFFDPTSGDAIGVQDRVGAPSADRPVVSDR
jgi:multiple sugar transport system ATP-binding protein